MAENYQPFIEYNFSKWNSPDGYSCVELPNNSGVYVIAVPEFIDGKLKYKILYVGSTKNIFKRYCNHEKRMMIKRDEGYSKFYFIECPDFRKQEKILIKELQPKYNKYGK